MPFDGRGFEQQDDVLDLLRRARERIARGWCQGELFVEGGMFRSERYCVTGALILDPELGANSNILCLAQAAVKKARPPGYLTITSYNDTPGRTQAEIVALFDAAIAARESA